MMIWLFFNPASLNALPRSGASNSVYRADVLVSGRMTATGPLPLATTLFRYFMVVKFALNVLSETVGVLAELTAGITETANPPTRATAASALVFFKFICPQPFFGTSRHRYISDA